jgi:hypothetical protein
MKPKEVFNDTVDDKTLDEVADHGDEKIPDPYLEDPDWDGVQDPEAVSDD